MNNAVKNDPRIRLESLYTEMQPEGLFPLWEALSDLVPRVPNSSAKVHKWSYAIARDYLMRAGELISAAQAERRVLILENPGLPGHAGITPSLYAGLQLILPGEVAPAHRHSQCALRFVLEGDGAYTSVDGERAIMRPFDLVLTPGGQWHDHGNPSDTAMIWLDGLDIPTVRHFDAGFSEKYPQEQFPTRAVPNDSLNRYGRNLRPLRGRLADSRPEHQPLFYYPYVEWRAALETLSANSTEADPHLGHALEFLNPADGGDIMPTISAHVRLLPAGFVGRDRRSSDGSIYVIVEGHGEVVIDGARIALEPRDILAVPSWRKVRFAAESQMILFGYSDKACQRKLNLYREEDL
jgi:gentisate 1,2-dioxygenase